MNVGIGPSLSRSPRNFRKVPQIGRANEDPKKSEERKAFLPRPPRLNRRLMKKSFVRVMIDGSRICPHFAVSRRGRNESCGREKRPISGD